MNDLKAFLDEKVNQYNHPDFITSDPVQVPRMFSQKENIEIAGFLAATIAWGQRPAIIKNAFRWIKLMDNNPFDFIMNSTENDWQHLLDFKHRTFNGIDCIYFIRSVQHIYKNLGGLEEVFTKGFEIDGTAFSALNYFRQQFFILNHPQRTLKHVSNVTKGASAKRLNMFLRWMVRTDNCGVDFGLWRSILPSQLMLPLDIHTGNVARKLELLTRKSSDWKAVELLTQQLRAFDTNDPVKYDFALFGLGIFEGMK